MSDVAVGTVIVVGWRKNRCAFWTGSEWTDNMAVAARMSDADARKLVRSLRADDDRLVDDVDAIRRWGEIDESTLDV